jgi:hypothetical protein
VKVVPTPLSGHLVGIVAGGGKHPLPSPLSAGIGILALQGIGQNDPTQPPLEIFLVLALHSLEMSSKGFLHRCGKHRIPVLVALAGSNDDLVL